MRHTLHLPVIRKEKRAYRPKINWTDEKLTKLISEFPYRFNKELAEELGCSWRTLRRKAAELGLKKEPNFLDKNRNIITDMAKAAQPESPYKGMKGWFVPNSENHRFKPGHISPTTNNPEMVKQIHEKRNATIARERFRIKYGLPQLTKLNLK